MIEGPYTGNSKISAAPSIRRLPSYLNLIRNMRSEGEEYVSGTAIAQELYLESIQVRKDLSITGVKGKPKKGYPVDLLIGAIERFLGWDTLQDAVIVGAGNLGTALIGYQEFQLNGLNIIAAFDKDPKKAGATVHGIPVFNMATIDINIPLFGVKIAILTVPTIYAQDTTDILIKTGITGIWNFTNTKLKVPPHVVVQKEDLSSGYAMLCAKMRSRQSPVIV
jgi:redox-sensing transcriptional repressor